MAPADETLTSVRDHRFFLLVGTAADGTHFIVLESFAKDRQAATWILAAREALRDLPVQVVQVVADGGKAIAALAKHFEAHLSPDLMHVLQPMVRSIWAAVGKRLKPDKPSAPSLEAVSEVQQQADTLKVALQEINAAYHPLQMNTGQWQSTHQAIERIDTAFETIEAVCNALQLEERARKAVRKSQAYLDAMVRTVGRAERLRKRLLNSVPPLERQAVDVEWRAAYLDKMARSASAAERTTLHQLAAQLRQELGPHHVLSEHAADAVQQGIAMPFRAVLLLRRRTQRGPRIVPSWCTPYQHKTPGSSHLYPQLLYAQTRRHHSRRAVLRAQARRPLRVHAQPHGLLHVTSQHSITYTDPMNR